METRLVLLPSLPSSLTFPSFLTTSPPPFLLRTTREARKGNGWSPCMAQFGGTNWVLAPHPGWVGAMWVDPRDWPGGTSVHSQGPFLPYSLHWGAASPVQGVGRRLTSALWTRTQRNPASGRSGGLSSRLPGPEPSPPDIHPAPPSCRRSLFLPQQIHAKEKEGFLERKSIARDRDRGERERTERSVLSVSRWYKDPVSFFPQTCKHLRVGTLPVLSLMNLQCLRGERKNSTYQHAHGEGFLGDGSYYSLFISFLQRTYIKYIKRINNRCICLI